MMRTLLIVVLAFGLALPLYAQQGQPTPEDMEKMMAEYAKLGAPGPEHEKLATLAGDWINRSRMWMSPDAEPVETSPGEHKGEMILGGRFLRFTESGEMMGQRMEGLGFLGYDKVKGQYTLLWMDNFGTGMYTAAGTVDAAGKTITLQGKVDDPVTGEKNKDVRYVYHFEGPDRVVFEMWDSAGGNEFRTMETIYTRK